MDPIDGFTPAEQFIFEWQYHLLGDFRQALIEAILRADKDNLDRLALGFPVEVMGYRAFSYVPNWWQEVEQRFAAAGYLNIGG